MSRARVDYDFAVLRVVPRVHTGAFVNVGVVLICPQANCFNHLFETRHCQRITNFFPELNVKVFQAGLSGLLE
ncbi:MAG: DUF3037 domain-containing protein, partial [bacterium]